MFEPKKLRDLDGLSLFSRRRLLVFFEREVLCNLDGLSLSTRDRLFDLVLMMLSTVFRHLD